MGAQKISRDQVVAALLAVFRARGYDGASMADLQAATGLTKGGLYHHFPGGKEAMADAALALVAAIFERVAFAPLESAAPPAARLAAMTVALDDYFAQGRTPCLPALLALGTSRDRFSDAIQAYFQRWIAALATALRDAGVPSEAAAARAEALVAEIQGALVLSRALDASGPFQRALARLKSVSATPQEIETIQRQPAPNTGEGGAVDPVKRFAEDKHRQD